MKQLARLGCGLLSVVSIAAGAYDFRNGFGVVSMPRLEHVPGRSGFVLILFGGILLAIAVAPRLWRAGDS